MATLFLDVVLEGLSGSAAMIESIVAVVSHLQDRCVGQAVAARWA
jgi:hypothetical protein